MSPKHHAGHQGHHEDPYPLCSAFEFASPNPCALICLIFPPPEAKHFIPVLQVSKLRLQGYQVPCSKLRSRTELTPRFPASSFQDSELSANSVFWKSREEKVKPHSPAGFLEEVEFKQSLGKLWNPNRSRANYGLPAKSGQPLVFVNKAY